MFAKTIRKLSKVLFGYVNTSHGKVATSVSAKQNFSSTQTIDFDTVNATILNQNTNVETSVATTTSISTDDETTVTRDFFSFPITVDFIFPVSTSRFGFPVTTGQKCQAEQVVSREGEVVSANAVSNSVNATDVSPASSSQTYTSFDSSGVFYNCHIATAKNILTTVSRGCSQDENED
jgi:hypothetical protein